MKNPKAKPRNTLTKEIKAVAQRRDFISTYHAGEIAKYGRRLTKQEDLLMGFYASMAMVKRISEGQKLHPSDNWFGPDSEGKETGPHTFREVMEMSVEHCSKWLCEIFIKAVSAGDFEKILELAEAVRFLKTHKYPVHRDADPERAALLLLKTRFRHEDKDEDKMTIREVAEYLAWARSWKWSDPIPKLFPKVETPADGFSALRRKCREVGLQLAPSRKIRKK